jgi:hypothetical protein
MFPIHGSKSGHYYLDGGFTVSRHYLVLIARSNPNAWVEKKQVMMSTPVGMTDRSIQFLSLFFLRVTQFSSLNDQETELVHDELCDL